MPPRLIARLLLLSGLCWLLGCHAFQINAPVHDKLKKSDRLDWEPLAAPSKNSYRVSQFVFISDFELQRDLPIFRELTLMRDQVYKDLQLQSSNTVVQVYVFETRDRYERYMHAKYPELPKRRAFFVAQPHSVGGSEDLMVYTYWGDRIREDLRHELTHALLHSVLKDVPLWLDEGLAEYFEVPTEHKGINFNHLDFIQRRGANAFKPDLSRLEQLGQVQQMSPAEYRESWAWVHLMMCDKPETKKVLVNYLQQLRTNPNPGSLKPALTEAIVNPDELLTRHLTQLDAAPRPLTPTVRRP